MKIGRTNDGKYVVGHVARARGKPDIIRELILETANFDGKRVRISIPQDPGQAGVWQADLLIKDLAGYMVEATPETGEKADRARPFAAQVNRGNVTMINGDWNAAYREELRALPNGKFKDQVDASSRAFVRWSRSIASPWSSPGSCSTRSGPQSHRGRRGETTSSRRSTAMKHG